MPKIRPYDIIHLHSTSKVYFPLVKTIASWLFDLAFELQEKNAVTWLISEKYQASNTPSF